MRQLTLAILATLLSASAEAAVTPATVYFPSADGKTELVGYLYTPASSGRHPAIVLLHGRAGPYSSNVNEGCTLVARGTSSPCNAGTLSRRHQMWADYWAERGYVVLLVDSFGPRGRGHGYGRGTHDDADREDVNERTVRPLDAEGALAYILQRTDVRAEHVFLQGWSNGASTTLNAMYRQAEGTAAKSSARFRAALAFYPGCGPRALLSQRYRSDAKIWVFLGSDDEEVSPKVCDEVLRRASSSGSPIEVVWYEGATHDFDDPGKARQAVPGNRTAQADALRRSAGFIGSVQ